MMVENNKVYITSDEIREVFGELTGGEWQEWNDIVAYYDTLYNKSKRDGLVLPFGDFDRDYDLIMKSFEFINFIDESLKGVDLIFDCNINDVIEINKPNSNGHRLFGSVYSTKYGKIIHSITSSPLSYRTRYTYSAHHIYSTKYGQIINWACMFYTDLISPKLSPFNKFWDVLDVIISPSVAICSCLDVLNADAEDYDDFYGGQMYCIDYLFKYGVEQLWENYQKTDDYLRRLAFTITVEGIQKDFDDLFKNANTYEDIVLIDGKLTIVNNSEIYQAVLPEEVFECLKIKEEVKKEKEREQ